MKKSLKVVLMAIVLALFVTIPAQASTNNDLAGISQQQTPAFMQDLEFNFKTEAEMAEVRGEYLNLLLYIGVATGIIKYYGARLLYDPRVVGGLTALKNWAGNWKGNLPNVTKMRANGSIVVQTVAGWVPLENITTPAMIGN